MDREKRCSERETVGPFEAVLECDGVNYAGVVENVGKHGLHMITVSKNHVASFIPEVVYKLEFKTPSDEKAWVKCEIRWVHINKTPFHGFTYRMGMEIMECSSSYNQILNSIESSSTK